MWGKTLAAGAPSFNIPYHRTFGNAKVAAIQGKRIIDFAKRKADIFRFLSRGSVQSAPSRKKCALPEKTGLSARCRVNGICLSRFAPSHPASAPSPSGFLHAAHFLCRIDCWGMRPRLSPNWQFVLSFRTNLRSSPRPSPN